MVDKSFLCAVFVAIASFICVSTAISDVTDGALSCFNQETTTDHDMNENIDFFLLLTNRIALLAVGS